MTSESAGAGRWEEISPVFADVLREYFEEQGRDPDSESSRSTIRTNTELVPRRAENVVAWLRDLGGLETLSGRCIVELGCGFGAVAAYLAVVHDPATVDAVDSNRSYLTRARAAAERIGLGERLAFHEGDMRTVSLVVDPDSADAVVLNNAFIYLTSPADEEAALRECFSILRPGGVILLHHANKWRWREPFSKDPVVHLLPARVAATVSRVTGWRHNHGRVRLLSPLEMRRRLRHAGFERVRIGDAHGREVGRRAYVAPYYVTAASKPE